VGCRRPASAADASSMLPLSTWFARPTSARQLGRPLSVVRCRSVLPSDGPYLPPCRSRRILNSGAITNTRTVDEETKSDGISATVYKYSETYTPQERTKAYPTGKPKTLYAFSNPFMISPAFFQSPSCTKSISTKFGFLPPEYFMHPSASRRILSKASVN
jgi:hypothetical protein